MRIRRSASHILGSAYFVPVVPSPKVSPPPPYVVSCLASLGFRGAGGISSSATPSGELCELNRLLKDLSLSDPKVVGVLQDIMPATLVKEKKKQVVATNRKVKAHLQAPKKTVAKKENTSNKVVTKTKKENMEGEAKKKAKVKSEDGEEGPSHVFLCKRSDGRGWYCKQRVSHPNTLCERHFKHRHSYLNPTSAIEEEKVVEMALVAPSKPSCSSNTGKKKSTNYFNATEGFYYYAGFGPSPVKKRCRSTTHIFAHLAFKQEEVELEVPKESSPLN